MRPGMESSKREEKRGATYNGAKARHGDREGWGGAKAGQRY